MAKVKAETTRNYEKGDLVSAKVKRYEKWPAKLRERKARFIFRFLSQVIAKAANTTESTVVFIGTKEK